MKKLFFIIIILMSFSSISLSKESKDHIPKNIIAVTGTCITETPADFAYFTFQINGYGKNLNNAVKNAKDKVALISESLFKIGLKDKDLETSRFYSSENYDNKAFLSSNRDYVACIDVKVNIQDFALLEKAIITVANFEPHEMSDMKFDLKNIKQIKLNTLETAVRNAKEKAELISKNLNIKHIKAINVEEIDDNIPVTLSQYSSFANSAVMGGGLSSTNGASFFVETIKIVKTVKIVFQIIKDENEENGQN